MTRPVFRKRSIRTNELLESRLALAAIAFATHDIACCGLNVESVVTADLDADGDLDIVTARSTEVAWRENLQGDANFSEPKTISRSVEGNNGIAVIATDLDNDGDLDIVSAAFRFRSRFSSVNKIAWYENLDGKANFGTQKIISTETDGVRSIFAADIDGDGHTDILAASQQDDTISWFQNQNGDFGERRIVSSNIRGASSVFAGDIDRDGDLDVVSGSPTDGIVTWHENTNGLGVFADPLVVSDRAGSVTSIVAGDLDGDGDLDVATTSAQFAVEQENMVAWYENLNGLGSFGEQRIVSLLHDGPRNLIADDVDGDEDLDLIVSSAIDDKIAWYENLDGRADYGEQQVVSTNIDAGKGIATGDLDNDGDLEIVSSEISFYENTDGTGNFSQRTLLSSIAKRINEITHSDVDSDGDLDIVVALPSEIAWYENTDGNGRYGGQRTLISNINSQLTVLASDIDGDGDDDLVSMTFDHLIWYENQDGLGNFADRRFVSDSDSIIEGIFSTIVATDLDLDGDNDIVLSYTFDDQFIEWYENLDGNGNFSEPNFIATQNDVFETSIFVSDLNGDNHLDILAASSADEKIVWYQGKGDGRFETAQPVTESDDDSQSVVAIDLDGDGDQDVLSASYYYEQVKWYENTNGQATVFREHIVDSIAIERAEFLNLTIRAADMDGDSDPDIVLDSARYDRSQEQSTSEITWFENVDSKGRFGPQTQIMSQPDGIFRLDGDLADLDSDGDFDVISAAYRSGGISWYENRIPGDVDDNGIFDSSDLVALFQAGEYEDEVEGNSTFDEGDWNGDGDADSADLVFAFQSGRFVAEARPTVLDSRRIDLLFQRDFA